VTGSSQAAPGADRGRLKIGMRLKLTGRAIHPSAPPESMLRGEFNSIWDTLDRSVQEET